MKYLYSWLKEFYPAIPAQSELEALLIQLGHDVASIKPVAFDGVVVAEIKAITPHPNADRLQLATIFDGTETHTVVCGAPNIAVEQKVPYAQIGTTLPCGLTLKPLAIRGVDSDGMLCAADELGISDDHSGLLLLPADSVVGTPLGNVVPTDAVIDLDITSNRGDVMSHFGLARDIAAAHGTKLEYAFPETTSSLPSSVTLGKVHNDAPSFAVGGVAYEKLTATPLYMATRLTLLDSATVNLPTDITNYLMLAFGQPLHAYNADALNQSGEFGVRRAHDGERINALNGKIYVLTPQNLLITANDTPVALAGIIGGNEAKVTANTKHVIFESTRFTPQAITLSARGLDLLTDAALRFERSIDPMLSLPVLNLAQQLLAKATNGSIEQIQSTAQDTPEPKVIHTSLELLQEKLGTTLSLDTAQTLLTALGCGVKVFEGEVLEITVPRWRSDVSVPADIVEELARLIGLNNLQKNALPPSVPQWKRSKYWRREYLKDMLVAQGGIEIATYPFVSEASYNNETAQVLDKPIHNKLYMRLNLKVNQLETISFNPETPFLVLFELARIYPEAGERERLAITVSGSNSDDVDSWWQNFFERFRVPVSSWMSRVITIDAETLQEYKIRKPIATYLELDPDDLDVTRQHDILPVHVPDIDSITYTPLSKYQASRRDIAFVVNAAYDIDDIAKQLSEIDPLIIAVELFDHYTNAAKLGSDKQSLAYHIVYQSPDKTLTSDEIQTIHNKVEAYIQEHLHGTIR